jgi:hypothetical protein
MEAFNHTQHRTYTISNAAIFFAITVVQVLMFYSLVLLLSSMFQTKPMTFSFLLWWKH